jgi:phytoene dehydrogenase-like protein
MPHFDSDVAVVGGGLGGLAAATLAARRGLRVALFERAQALGGRAATRAHRGFSFNLGAHALYRRGPAARVLAAIGAKWSGGPPPANGLAVLGSRRHTLPATFGSLVTTGLFGWSAKTEGARFFSRLRSIDTRALDCVSLASWLDGTVADPTLRASLEAFIRLTTFANAPAHLSAGAAIDQLRFAQRSGVAYLDGGWQTLVTGASAAARSAGVHLATEARVLAASPAGGGWRLHAEGAAPHACRTLVLAAGPAAARSIVASDALAAWTDRATPQKVACLDVALRRLPDEKATFAIALDAPLYFSVHSRSARVAPDGTALVTTLKYLAPGAPPDPARDEAELEGWLDRLQPGWRDVLVERQWLPAMVATQALPTAAAGGLAGRPGPRVPDAPGVFVVGDWVGPEGMLLDASLASAESAIGAACEALALTLTRTPTPTRGRPVPRVA